MFDARTRYSQEVLERVREKFEDKVFDTVIRYNIRLRETVDHGVAYRGLRQARDRPEGLRGTVRRGDGRGNTVAEIEASSGAEEISRTTREYLDTMEPVPMSDVDSESETEDVASFPYPAQSSYSAMIKAIAGGALPEWSDESEEPDS